MIINTKAAKGVAAFGYSFASHYIDIISQHASLLQWPQEHGRITTLQAINDICIIHPAQRVVGCNIAIYWRRDVDANMQKHKQGQYMLLPGKWGAVWRGQ